MATAVVSGEILSVVAFCVANMFGFTLWHMCVYFEQAAIASSNALALF